MTDPTQPAPPADPAYPPATPPADVPAPVEADATVDGDVARPGEEGDARPDTHPAYETPEGALATQKVGEDDPEGRDAGAEVPVPRQPDTVENPNGPRSSETDAATAATDGVYADADPVMDPAQVGGSPATADLGDGAPAPGTDPDAVSA